MPVDLHRASLYQASVPVFARYLERLRALVDAAEDHARDRGLAADELLAARLAPDMFTFEQQVQIAANFALRASYPIAGQTLPPASEFPATFAGLRAHISHVAGLLARLDPAHFQSAGDRVVESKAGRALVSLPAPEFLHLYAMPNFFFHVTLAYAILRSRGVAIGKENFDGFHSYRDET